jgi:hypothetical protein
MHVGCWKISAKPSWIVNVQPIGGALVDEAIGINLPTNSW